MGEQYENANAALLKSVYRFKSNQDPDAFDQIAATLHGYLYHLAVRKFFRVPGHNSEDIYQEGLIALATKAIPDYDEEKGAFISFAKLCIKRHIITILKSSNNNRNGPLNGAMSLDATVCDDDEDGPIPISGFLPNGQPDMVQVMLRLEGNDRLKKLLGKRLTPLESTVLSEYLKSMSYLDIKTFMNRRRRGKNRVCTKTIDNALCRIKKKAIDLDESLRHNRKERGKSLGD